MTSQSARTDKDEEQWTFLDAAGQCATFLNVCGKQLGVTCLLNLNVHMFWVHLLEKGLACMSRNLDKKFYSDCVYNRQAHTHKHKAKQQHWNERATHHGKRGKQCIHYGKFRGSSI